MEVEECDRLRSLCYGKVQRQLVGGSVIEERIRRSQEFRGSGAWASTALHVEGSDLQLRRLVSEAFRDSAAGEKGSARILEAKIDVTRLPQIRGTCRRPEDGTGMPRGPSFT